MDLLDWRVLGVLASVLATCVALAFTLKWHFASLGPSPKITGKAHQVNDPQVNYLNDSLCELYKPSGPPRMQILFFHGFQHGDYTEAHLSTWKSGDDSCIWPQTWLAEEFNDAHIFSVSYNVSLMNRASEHMDVYNIQENLMSDLLQEHIGQEFGARCPVVLVGHSFGGLIIKQLCTYARQKGRQEHKDFLNSVSGVFFYATPHHGIRFPKLAEHFVTHGPLLNYVKVLSKTTARLNEDFEELRKEHKTWLMAGIGESLPIKWGLFRASVVVTEASSRYGYDFHIVPGVDHISICRPKTKTSRSFKNLTRLLNVIYSASKCVLVGGARLPREESLVSVGQQYTFRNQEDGNLCICNKDGEAIWASRSNLKRRRGRGDLKLLTDGNLVHYNSVGTGLPLWASMSQGITRGPHKLVMQDDGNLVIYGSGPWSKNARAWAIQSENSSGVFTNVDGNEEMPSDRVTWLETYGTLVSHNMQYTFINQGDGNLCIYNQDEDCIWASHTWGRGSGNVYMQRDGNLVLYNTKGDGAALWASGTYGHGTAPYKLIMQNDGNLVIYDAHHNPTWASHTAR